MRLILGVLSIAFLGLQYKLWFADDGLLQWKQLSHRIQLQIEQNTVQADKNHKLEAEISGLKAGENALEEIARYELGMVKEGEVYYQITP